MAWRVEKFSTNLLSAANSNNLAMSDGRDWSRTALWSEPKNNLYDIHRAIARIYGWNTDETPGARPLTSTGSYDWQNIYSGRK